MDRQEIASSQERLDALRQSMPKSHTLEDIIGHCLDLRAFLASLLSSTNSSHLSQDDRIEDGLKAFLKAGIAAIDNLVNTEAEVGTIKTRIKPQLALAQLTLDRARQECDDHDRRVTQQ